MMRRRLLSYPLLICLITLFVGSSCVRDVRIDLGPLPDRIVLNASASPDGDVRAHLSKTWFIMDSLPEFELPGATARVYINDIYQGEMLSDDMPEDSVHPVGQFILPGCRVKTGDLLRVEASAPGFDPVWGETLIPDKAEVTSVDTMTFDSSSSSYYYYGQGMRLTTYMSLPGPTGYYRLVVERVTDYQKGDTIITLTSYDGLGGYGYNNYGYGYSYGYGYNGYTGLYLTYEDAVFQSYGGSPIVGQMDGRYCMGVFTDLVGTRDGIRVSFAPVDYSYRGDPISTTVHYEVRLLSISEAYYRYLYVMRGFSIQIGDANFGALVEPADTYSNVERGFGVVAGYQLSSYRITMPFDTVPPQWHPWMYEGYPYGL